MTCLLALYLADGDVLQSAFAIVKYHLMVHDCGVGRRREVDDVHQILTLLHTH